MPVLLKDFRATKMVELPSFPGSQVEIYDSLLVRDMASVDSESGSQIQKGLRMLPLYIKSWNFQDEQEKPLPINAEGIGFFKEPDVLFLLDQIKKFGDENKKKE